MTSFGFALSYKIWLQNKGLCFAYGLLFSGGLLSQCSYFRSVLRDVVHSRNQIDLRPGTMLRSGKVAMSRTFLKELLATQQLSV